MVVATNPCACGYYPDMSRCTCTPAEIQQYIGRISQALLNRIDLCIEVREMHYQDIKKESPSESSAEIRERILQVHQIQQERFADCAYSYNSEMPLEDVHIFCRLDAESEQVLEAKYAEYHLTARTYCKVLRVARTIADLAGFSQIKREHLEEAFLYRSPDQKYWRRY